MLKIILCLAMLLMLAACGRNTGHDTPPVEIIYDPVTYEESNVDDVIPMENGEDYETTLPDIPQHNEYIITLEVDPETRTVQGISRISFTNRSGKPLETIVLRVFLNAFDPDVYPRPYTEDVEWRMYRLGSDLGYLTVEYVFMNNEALEYNIEGTVLTLRLEEPIEPDATVLFSLQYSAHVPMLGHIMGGNDAGMWFGMFLPVLSVYGYDGWYKDAFYPIGHPFYLEAANYQVEITTPLRYNVVGTGHRSQEVIYDTDIKITRFTANMTRDFAFAVLSPYYNSASTITGSGVEINFYYQTEVVGERAEDILEFARFNIEQFGHRVGVYPFGQINIVETDLLQDSIAFSQMVFADTRHLWRSDLSDLSYSLGSQWFASVVGINPIAEPWLDIGLTRFVQASIVHYTPELLHEYMQQTRRDIAAHRGLLLTDGLWAYTQREYFIAAQGQRAMLMLYQLQRRMGEDAFWSFINLYYQTFSFRVATVEGFIYMAEEVYGHCLQEFFETWMTQDVIPILQLR